MNSSNITRTNRWLSIFTAVIVWASASSVIYYFYFQNATTKLSYKSITAAELIGFVPAGLILGLLFWKPGLLKRITLWKMVICAIASLFVCLVLWVDRPGEAFLFAPQSQLELQVQAEGQNASPVVINWINDGLDDVSFANVSLNPGSSFDQHSIRLVFSPQGEAGLSWRGRSWREIRIILHSTTPVKITAILDDARYVIMHNPGEKTEQILLLPVKDEQYYQNIKLPFIAATFLLSFVVILLVWLLVVDGTFVLIRNILVGLNGFFPRLEKRIPLLMSPAQTQALVAVGFGGIAVFFAVIGSNNRLYADDYYYFRILHQYGVFGAVGVAFRTLNGRFMSHLFDFLAFNLGSISLGLGAVFAYLFIGGSLYFLFLQVLDGENSQHRKRFALLCSLVVIVGTFLIEPDLYEAIYWTLHAMILSGGLLFTNISIGLFLLLLRTRINPNYRLPIIAGFGVLGFLAATFNEAISIFLLALFGLVILALFLKRRDFSPGRDLIAPAAAFVVSAMLGLMVVVTSPGNAKRVSEIGTNSNLLDIIKMYFTLFRNIYGGIFFNNPIRGLILFLAVLLIGYVFGRFIPYRIQLGTIKLHLYEKVILLLLPFLLTMLMFAPSAMANGYFPYRTMYVPIYVLLVSYFIAAVITGNARRSFDEGRSLSWAVGAAVMGIAIGSIVFQAGLYQKMGQFAAEWDAREAFIQQTIAEGKKEIQVTPYKHGFGLDIQKEKDHWYTKYLDDYYGISFSRAEGK